LVEQFIRNEKVASSIPASGTRLKQKPALSQEARVFVFWSLPGAVFGARPAVQARRPQYLDLAASTPDFRSAESSVELVFEWQT
jgi:hypothetical protein